MKKTILIFAICTFLYSNEEFPLVSSMPSYDELEFVSYDYFPKQKDKMANTYVFLHKNKVQAFFSILNDCLHDKGYENNIWNKFHRKRKIPNNKRFKQYPAIKIGRCMDVLIMH